MAAPLPHLLIAVKEIVLQKLSVSDMQNLKTLSEHSECRWQVFSFKRDNLMKPIEMQVSPKQKTFSEFFAAFLQSRLNFELFQKKG